ncbi:E3 ubiquitin protein ligase SIRP1-like protein [Tanacetum coccineum]
MTQFLQRLADNDPNRYGTPPAKKDAVEAMPTVTIEEDSVQCSVPEMPTDESKNNRDQDESRGGSVESGNERNGEERRSSLTFPWPPTVSMVLMQRVAAAARRKMRLYIRRNDLFIVKSIVGQHIVEGVISVCDWI